MDIQRLFDSAVFGALQRGIFRGQVGKLNASGSPTIRVPGKTNSIYVRLVGGGNAVEAFALGASFRAHAPVSVLKMFDAWIAIPDASIISEAYADGNPDDGSVRYHTHAIGSGREYQVEALRLEPGNVYFSSGLTVAINRLRYPDDGSGVTFTGGTIDLTSYLPSTTGKWGWIVVGVDPATNTAVAATGNDFDTQAELTIAEIDNVSFDGYIPLCAIQANEADTTLNDIRRYYDARLWLVQANSMDHGALSGLTSGDDHTQYALLDGRSGGQTLRGGTESEDDLVLESTSNATKGVIVLQPNGGRTGFGIANPDGLVHIHVGSAGSVAANSNADDLVVEGSENSGFSVLVPNASTGYFGIGSPSSALGLFLRHTYDNTLAELSTNYADGQISIKTGNQAEAIRITSTQQIGIRISNPDGTMHIHTASAGTVTASAGADDLVVECDGNGGISILVPDDANANLIFGSPGDEVGAVVQWAHDSDLMSIGTRHTDAEIAFQVGNNQEAVRIDGSGNVGIGTSSPSAELEVNGDIVANGIGFGNEKLSAYREGTWDVTITGSAGNPTISFTDRLAEYTIVGNRCLFNLCMHLNAFSGGDGEARISLPFVSASTEDIYCTFSGHHIDYPDTPVGLYLTIKAGQSYGLIRVSRDNLNRGTVSISDIQPGDLLNATGHYPI